ncbi:hypothetical protein TKK_0011082 [Trichogramma kaykai]
MAFVPDDNNLGVIRGFIELGMSSAEIAIRAQCNKKTVKKWRSRLRLGVPMEDGRKNNSGQIKVSEENLEAVVRQLQEEPFNSVKNAHAVLHIPGSVKTLRKAMKDRTNMRFRRPATKPRLLAPHYEKRMIYAQTNSDMTEFMWWQTIFMDEKTFSSTKDGRTGVWRPIGSRFDEENCIESTVSGRHSMSFYGWFNGDGNADLIEIDRKLNAKQYVHILDTWFYPRVMELYPDAEEIYIVEDNSPIHTAKDVQFWYQEHPHLILLDHPPRSPDLNPIENMWAQLTRNWVPEDIRTPAAMRNKLRDSWNALLRNPQYFERLTRSMPARLQEVLLRQGAPTHY